jgi:hypothetical protein
MVLQKGCCRTQLRGKPAECNREHLNKSENSRIFKKKKEDDIAENAGYNRNQLVTAG